MTSKQCPVYRQKRGEKVSITSSMLNYGNLLLCACWTERSPIRNQMRKMKRYRHFLVHYQGKQQFERVNYFKISKKRERDLLLQRLTIYTNLHCTRYSTNIPIESKYSNVKLTFILTTRICIDQLIEWITHSQFTIFIVTIELELQLQPKQ